MIILLPRIGVELPELPKGISWHFCMRSLQFACTLLAAPASPPSGVLLMLSTVAESSVMELYKKYSMYKVWEVEQLWRLTQTERSCAFCSCRHGTDLPFRLLSVSSCLLVFVIALYFACGSSWVNAWLNSSRGSSHPLGHILVSCGVDLITCRPRGCFFINGIFCSYLLQ